MSLRPSIIFLLFVLLHESPTGVTHTEQVNDLSDNVKITSVQRQQKCQGRTSNTDNLKAKGA